MPTFSPSLEKALHQALTLANERHHEYATLEHLLLALIEDADAAAVMGACNVNLDQLRSIVDIQLGYLRKRLADREMELLLDDSARDLLAEAGFDPVYGARPLKRAIQQQVENPLAQRILRGDFGPRSRIKVAAKNSELVFDKG